MVLGRLLSLVLLVFMVIVCSGIRLAAADQFDGDEFVNEILEEERKHYGERDDPFLRDKDVLEEKQQQARADEDRRQAQAEQIREQREAAFQKELVKMDHEQQKRAKAQKRKDALVVHGILKAYQRGDIYGVLPLVKFIAIA